MNETSTYKFDTKKAMKYKEPSLMIMNLGDQANPHNLLVVDDWNPLSKSATFKIFLKYKDVFA